MAKLQQAFVYASKLQNSQLWRNFQLCASYVACRRLYSSDVELSKNRYHVKRGDFAQLSDTDLKHFEKILPGSSQVLKIVDDVAPYNVDWLKVFKGLL